MENIFLQLGLLLGITVTIAFFMRLLRQPLMIAYIVAGIVAGPLFLNIIHGDVETLDAFAEFGVILLLFLVGLSLNINHIRRIGKVAVITGVGQVLFTASVGFGIMRLLGFDALSSFFVATAITFSSTIIIVKLLADKKDTETTYGRYTLGLMVVQDIVAVGFMLVMTSLQEGGSLPEALSILLIKSILLLSLVYFLSKFVLNKLLDIVAKSSEFLFIFTIAWLFGISAALYWAGFGLEIGAIIAGISLGSSPYASQIGSRIKPMRDFFIVLFFIILGSEMQVSGISESLVPAAILSIFILLGNPLILYLLFRLQKFSRRNSFLAGVTAAQVSEFGFILLFTGQLNGHLTGTRELPIFTMVALITIFVSSYAITYNEQLYRFLLPWFKLFGPDQHVQKEIKEERYDAIVFGYHRIGWKVVEALMEKKVSFAVVDFNPVAISKLKHRGITAYYGDAADIEFLSALPLEHAKLVISTLPEADDQIVLIKHVRFLSQKIRIVTNLYHITHLKELYRAGADYVMMPHLLGGSWIAEVIREKPWTKKTFSDLKKGQHEDLKARVNMGVHQH